MRFGNERRALPFNEEWAVSRQLMDRLRCVSSALAG